MTASFKAYFRDHFRSKLKLLLCLMIFALVLTFLSAIGGQRVEYKMNDGITDYSRVNYNALLGLPVFILCVCAYILPVTEFSLLKKRRNLDCFYALPISRREMGLVHYFTGLLTLFIPFTCSYLLNFLLLLRYPEGFCYSPILGLYCLCLVMGFVMYSMFTFLFNQANSTGDGIWFLVLWFAVISMVMDAYNSISGAIYKSFFWQEGVSDVWPDGPYWLWQRKWNVDSTLGIPVVLLSSICMTYSEVVEKYQGVTLMDLWGNRQMVILFAMWVLIGIGACAGFVATFGKERAERTQEVSDSWFGFKLLIPLYAYLGNIITCGVGFIPIFIVSFVGYIIYRKGFHLKKWDWLMLILQIPVAVIAFLLLEL